MTAGHREVVSAKDVGDFAANARDLVIKSASLTYEIAT